MTAELPCTGEKRAVREALDAPVAKVVESLGRASRAQLADTRGATEDREHFGIEKLRRGDVGILEEAGDPETERALQQVLDGRQRIDDDDHRRRSCSRSSRTSLRASAARPPDRKS